jgi:uncharacterized lipoprotein
MRDMINIAKSDLFVYSSDHLDPVAAKITKSMNNNDMHISTRWINRIYIHIFTTNLFCKAFKRKNRGINLVCVKKMIAIIGLMCLCLILSACSTNRDITHKQKKVILIISR